MTTREIFKANLKYYRKQNHYTQEKLAELIDCNPKYITEIESRAKFPSPETIDALAKALNITPEQLFRSEGCPTNTVAFDKQDFIDKIISGLSVKIEKELNNYLDKHLDK